MRTAPLAISTLAVLSLLDSHSKSGIALSVEIPPESNSFSENADSQAIELKPELSIDPPETFVAAPQSHFTSSYSSASHNSPSSNSTEPSFSPQDSSPLPNVPLETFEPASANLPTAQLVADSVSSEPIEVASDEPIQVLDESVQINTGISSNVEPNELHIETSEPRVVFDASAPVTIDDSEVATNEEIELPLEATGPRLVREVPVSVPEGTLSNGLNAEPELQVMPELVAPVEIDPEAVSSPFVLLVPTSPRITYGEPTPVLDGDPLSDPSEFQVGSTYIEMVPTVSAISEEVNQSLDDHVTSVRSCLAAKPNLFRLDERNGRRYSSQILFDGQVGTIVRDASGRLICPSALSIAVSPVETEPSVAFSAPRSVVVERPSPIVIRPPQPIVSGRAHPLLIGYLNTIASAQVYQQASRSVVAVRNEISDEIQTVIVGSGFFVEPNGVADEARDGLIVTNAHVVENLRRDDTLQVVLSDNSRHEARVVGFDPNGSDLALLEIDPSSEEVRPLALADADSVQEGELAYAIGTPFGRERYSNAFTSGVVSGLNPGEVLTDARISPGNSGGPLLNSRGEVIGVTTESFFEQGINLGLYGAINTDFVRQMLANDQTETLAETAPLSRVSNPVALEFNQDNLGPVSREAGTIDLSDRLLENGRRVEAFFFNLREASTVSIQMQSYGMNPFLMLSEYVNNGTKLELKGSNDNIGLNDKNAAINRHLPAGQYIIFAGNHGPNDFGDYQLNVRIAPQGSGAANLLNNLTTEPVQSV